MQLFSNTLTEITVPYQSGTTLKYSFTIIQPLVFTNEVTPDPTDYITKLNEETQAREQADAKLKEDNSELSESLCTTRGIEFEQGSIGSADGLDIGNYTRIRTKDYISLLYFREAGCSVEAKLNYFAYDENYNYLGTSGWIALGKSFNKDDAISRYPEAKYIRVIIARNTNTDITPDDVATYGIYIKQSNTWKIDVAYEKMKDLEPKVNYPEGPTYEGKRIDFRKPSFSYSRKDAGVGGQDGAVYGKYLFRVGVINNQNYLSILICDTGALVQRISFGDISPHGNSVVFGSERFNEDDPFPLLYVNAYEDSDLPLGTCYAYRIIAGESGYSMSLVQTISIGFTESDLWKDDSDYRAYGNFVIDTDRNYLYAYLPRVQKNLTRFFKFAMPSVSEGDVVLEIDDIIDTFDVDYINAPQGNAYCAGKIVIVSGLANDPTTRKISVVDVFSKKIESVIKDSVAINEYEPEMVNIINGKIWVAFGSKGYLLEV